MVEAVFSPGGVPECERDLHEAVAQQQGQNQQAPSVGGGGYQVGKLAPERKGRGDDKWYKNFRSIINITDLSINLEIEGYSMNKIHSLVLPSLGCGEDRSVGYLQRCYDVLHHHEVDKEDDKNDEERHVEESVLDQSS